MKLIHLKCIGKAGIKFVLLIDVNKVETIRFLHVSYVKLLSAPNNI